MTEILLEAQHLTKIFRRGKASLTAVDDVSFVLKRGSVLGIVGESGSGKSTVAAMLTRLTDVTEGRIFFEGRDVTHVTGPDRRDFYRQIQMVFQNPVSSFDPRRTLGDGIGESLINQGMNRAEVKKKTADLLEACGLEPSLAGRYPHQVSGGQCQRAAIARALAVSPSVLICDEATSALDVTVQAKIMALLMKIRQERHLSMILISHDLALVQKFCTDAVVMNSGRIVEAGGPDEIIRSPKTAYTKTLIDSVL